MSAKITIGGFLRAWCDCPLDLGCCREEPLLAAFASSGEGPALIDNNLIEPSTKMIAITAAPQIAERAHEGRLKYIIRVDARAKHSNSVSDAGVLMSADKQREGINVPRYDRGDQVSVR